MLKSLPSQSNRKWIYELIENNNPAYKLVEVFVKPKQWEKNDSHVILPFSVHSRIYDGIKGDLKIKSLVETVKSYARNKVLILLSECTHLHVLSIKHFSYEHALTKVKCDAALLLDRFREYFKSCDVAFWEDFIWKNSSYHLFKKQLQQEYENNADFRLVIQSDVERLNEAFDSGIFVDKQLFQEKACLDFLEMLTGIMVMHNENYKVIIYPGSKPNGGKYLQNFTNFNATFINAAIKVKNIKKYDGK